jgi:hypothetical protein
MVYLDQTIKPRSLTPHAFANRLRALNIYSVALPTNTGVPAELLTNDKLTAIYFRMMPISWQNSFRQAGKRMATYSLASLSEYMQTLSILDVWSNRNGNRGQGSSDNSSYRTSRSQGNGNSHGGRGRGGRGNNRPGRGHGRSTSRDARHSNTDGTNERSGGRMDNNVTCPVHGGHKWGACFLNPRGDSYRPYGRGSGREPGGRGVNPGRGPPMSASYYAHGPPNGYQANGPPNTYHVDTQPPQTGNAPGSYTPGGGYPPAHRM